MTIETPDSVRSTVRSPSLGDLTTASDGSESLRIAMVAPPWYALPPRGYGGIESVVTDLVNKLAERGHHITLIGSGTNGTRAQKFIPVFDVPPSERIGAAIPEVIHAAAVAEILADLDVDLVHDHSTAGPLLARGRPEPTIVTMHNSAVGDNGDYFAQLGDSVDVVAISNSQRRQNSRLNWVGRVYNAIDVGAFPFRADKDDYILWLGRFSPDKGPHLAIDAARAAGLRIILAGKRTELSEQEFFDAEIAPRLGPDAEYVGEADSATKKDLLARARALAFPLLWDEPFGMVMIEAMACGTPVVALPRGSVPEVVRHGVSGLVVRDLEDFPAALRAVDSLDPVDCRTHVEQRFNLSLMAEGYERIYRMLVSGSRTFEVLTSRRGGAA
jgi:glycosyltransferase involved in cell wall biosynthesis